MYAVSEIGGKQYIVKKGDTILVEKIELPQNAEYVIDKVLLVKTDDKVNVGTPYVSNAKIISEVVDQVRSQKIIVFRRSKSKKNWRRKHSHRQMYTMLRIKDIVLEE